MRYLFCRFTLFPPRKCRTFLSPYPIRNDFRFPLNKCLSNLTTAEGRMINQRIESEPSFGRRRRWVFSHFVASSMAQGRMISFFISEILGPYNARITCEHGRRLCTGKCKAEGDRRRPCASKDCDGRAQSG
jgi:hypothetical protein